MARMECGHHKEVGLTLPAEILEARGLINKDDKSLNPRIIERQKQAVEEYYKREFEKIYRLLQGVSHWMDSLGGMNPNPCYKKSIRTISRYASIKMNHEEMTQVYTGIRRLLAKLNEQGSIASREEELSKISRSVGGRRTKSQRKEIIQTHEGKSLTMDVSVERKDLLCG